MIIEILFDIYLLSLVLFLLFVGVEEFGWFRDEEVISVESMYVCLRCFVTYRVWTTYPMHFVHVKACDKCGLITSLTRVVKPEEDNEGVIHFGKEY